MLTKETIDDYVTRIPESGCWIWNGSVTEKGYGLLTTHNPKPKKTHRAHRYIFQLFGNSIPDGLQLDHLCRVRCCVNPAHLEPVTNRENQMRGISPTSINARKTHCYKGHELTPENIYITSEGSRRCRICHRARDLEIYYRKKNLKAMPLPKESKE